jgi:hypothetical protein
MFNKIIHFQEVLVCFRILISNIKLTKWNKEYLQINIYTQLENICIYICIYNCKESEGLYNTCAIQ